MKRICIFGDSITWGAGLPFRVAWANLLRSYFDSKGEDYIELYDLGIDGNTTEDLIKRFDIEAEARNPEVIIFAIGINDSMFRNKDNFDISEDQFLKNLETLHKKAKKFTNSIYFVGLVKGSDDLTIPLKRSITGKCYSKNAVKKYDLVIKEFCKNNEVVFIDVFNKLNNKDFIDGLHPNIEGHEKIFEEAKNVLENNFKNNKGV